MNKNNYNFWKKGMVLAIICLFVGASVVPSISGNIRGILSNPINGDNCFSQSFVVEWDARLNFTETGGCNDHVIFGEADDANDGPPADSYDAPDPGGPPTPPYINAWFDDGLPGPYAKLLADYRKYPDTYKVWDLYVLWYPSGCSSSSSVTISWSPSAVAESEYTSVNLDGVNMLTQSSYQFSANPCTPHHFTITAQGGGANNPPYTPSSPDPYDGEADVYVNADLSWSGGDPDGDPLTYNVYFGTTSSYTLVSNNQSITTFNPGMLQESTTYYWRIIAWDNYGASTEGPVWWFQTESDGTNNPPYIPNNPIPSNGADDISVSNVSLRWTGGDPDGDSVTYDVYFGTSSSPSKVVSNQVEEAYTLERLYAETTYYWKIVARDTHGVTIMGPLWTFATGSHENQPPLKPSKPSGPTSGKAGDKYTYSTSAVDPDGDQVQYYLWDWGDGVDKRSTIYGPFDSGENVEICHIWDEKGPYEIKAWAIDVKGAQSYHSDPLLVSMPKGKLSFDSLFWFFERFIERFPFLEQTLLNFHLGGS